ncbi:HD-GYP domain-containing protein [Brevibacillus dissolubilis]|uniref:HD-GYP domain-containing protein n=1 Tax=Brevibacillus dissolubilis TaxID=1844116 RepID=UPI0034CECD3C
MLSQRMIDRLVDMQINSIYIEDKRTEDIVVEDVISPETRREAMSVIYSTFETFREDPSRRKQMFANPQMGRQVRQVMHSLMDEIKDHRSAMNLLGTVCGVDHYVFAHSFNVTLYTLAIAVKMGFGERELIEIGIGAMLHDVGKMAIPYDILTKPGRLTDSEYEIMQTHTSVGFELLRKQDDIPLLAAHCAYQHHERLDGSGYPRHLKEPAIHQYAKLVGVCDVFDALTSNRVYRRAMLPHEAIELLFTGAGVQFDKEVVEQFRNTIALYPLGLSIQLNTGEKGVVVDNNVGVPSRPIVRILTDSDGQTVETPYELDLASKCNLNLIITDCEALG